MSFPDEIIELRSLEAPRQTFMSIRELYSEIPLPRLSKCIRLLDIEDATTETHDTPVTAQLRVIDLETTPKPQYAALSYVWGEDSPTERYAISCNGCELRVTQNCLSALKHLRKRLGSFSIWVDAVCINQSPKDVADEKEQQIPLMGEIYSRAQVTYVWLGDGTVQSDKAMVYLGKAGFLDYLCSTETGQSRVGAAIWSLYRTLRCGDNYPLLCTGQLLLAVDYLILFFNPN